MSTATTVIENLAARGVTLRVVAGRLEVKPASALTDRDRAAIRAHLAELLSVSRPEWNLDDAIRRMYDADTQVERLGVDGRHPAVQEAGGWVSAAFAAYDTEAFDTALTAFVATVRRVAAGRVARTEVA
jgi:hypothetical protein